MELVIGSRASSDDVLFIGIPGMGTTSKSLTGAFASYAHIFCVARSEKEPMCEFLVDEAATQKYGSYKLAYRNSITIDETLCNNVAVDIYMQLLQHPLMLDIVTGASSQKVVLLAWSAGCALSLRLVFTCC